MLACSPLARERVSAGSFCGRLTLFRITGIGTPSFTCEQDMQK
jgi:hypothetical protein